MVGVDLCCNDLMDEFGHPVTVQVTKDASVRASDLLGLAFWKGRSSPTRKCGFHVESSGRIDSLIIQISSILSYW